MKDRFLIVSDLKNGWFQRMDPSSIPLGGAQESVNITLTDKGGISPRPGEVLIGEDQDAGYGIRSMFSFKKTYGSDILMKTFGDRIEYYNNISESWCALKTGYQIDKVFGAKEHSTSIDALDWIYFGNGVDNYSRWCGYESKITTALVGGETTIQVDSTLLPDIFWEGTAISSTATTITVPANTWATDVWNDFYVRIASGANEGQISLITATTNNQITFNSLSGLTGGIQFEIRRIGVPNPTGTLIYNDTEVAYTAIPTDSSFTVTSAVACDEGEGVTVIPEEFPENPRGNIFETNIAQMYVAGVPKSKMTVYRSSLTDATDFNMSSPRSPDEGDIIFFPYAGHAISDMKKQENLLYIFKKDSVESLTYTQDQYDIAQIEPVIQGINIGTEARAWRMGNDIAYITPDKRITTIGRIIDKDFKPQTDDIGSNVRGALEKYGIDSVYGEEFGDRAFICLKSSQDVVKNDIMLISNKDYKSWEGYWQIPASAVVPHKGELYYGSSYTPNVYKMLTGRDKISGDNKFPIDARWKSGFINTNGHGYYLNEVSSIAVEGYITSQTTINVKLYKDFSYDSFQEFQIIGTETQFQDGVEMFNVIGVDSNGVEPLGSSGVFGPVDSEGRRHFIIYLDFQIVQLDYIAVEFSSYGFQQNWEVIRYGINATNTDFENQEKIKN